MILPFDHLGLKIIEDNHCADHIQFQFPRSKKKRIRKKWGKNSANYKYIPWDHGYLLHNEYFVCHPILAYQLRKEIINVESLNSS